MTVTDRKRGLAIPRTPGNGFTLIEMLVVLTIIGLLAAVAMPHLTMQPAFVGRARLRTGLAAAISAARQQALAGGRPVAIDLTPLAVTAPHYSAAIGVARAPIVYPDGSTSGGIVSEGGQPVVTLDWMTGRVGDARP